MNLTHAPTRTLYDSAFCDAFNLISRFYGWWCCKKSKWDEEKSSKCEGLFVFPLAGRKTYLTLIFRYNCDMTHIVVRFIVFQLMVLAINNFFILSLIKICFLHHLIRKWRKHACCVCEKVWEKNHFESCLALEVFWSHKLLNFANILRSHADIS